MAAAGLRFGSLGKMDKPWPNAGGPYQPTEAGKRQQPPGAEYSTKCLQLERVREGSIAAEPGPVLAVEPENFRTATIPQQPMDD
jgi:hypothetical protein